MPDNNEPLAIVLAAGKSTRMKSETPKVLHSVCGRPMIEYILDAARGANTSRIVVVVGHKAEMVQDALSHHEDLEFALQAEQNGTGHAVMMCEEQLASQQGPVLILAGDTPLLQTESLQGLLRQQREHNAACVIGSAVTEQNHGLGRIVRDGAGNFQQIVEQRDATPEQELIQEVNTGCYAFDGPKLYASLKQLRPENDQGEYYLTDCPAIMLKAGDTVLSCDELAIEEAMGVNTRVQLAEVTEIIQQRIIEQHMVEGVTFINPATNAIDYRAEIGRDTIIHPGVNILGQVTVGANCTIGPGAVIKSGISLPEGTEVAPLKVVE